MIDSKESIQEEEQLTSSKIEKLYEFIESDDFMKLKDIQKTLLIIQLDSMRTYWRCLKSLLKTF